MPKRSIKRDKFHLILISEAIDKIENFIKGKQYVKYLDDEMLFDAIAMNLAVIGERVKSLSDSFKRKNPHIPYAKIVGMRNLLTHKYHQMKKKVIWDTCKKKLPEFKKFIKESLKNLD